MSELSTVNFWAIVEIMGHVTIAGHVTEQAIAGGSMLRVDVPDTATSSAFTRLYGLGSIYSITPVSEDIARVAVEHMRERAVTVYGLALPAGYDEDEDEQ